MRFAINSAMALALVLPAWLGAQQNKETVATCRATLEGQVLTTVIEFADGYSVVGPWRVMAAKGTSAKGSSGVAMDATLDRVIERHKESGRDVTTPFPKPIETRFEGANQDELVTRAAQIWCVTVLKVQENHPTPSQEQQGRPDPPAPAPAPGSGPRLAWAAFR